MNLVVAQWHVVSDEDVPHVSSLYRYRNTTEFKADVEFFLRHYTPVTEQDVICHLHEGRALPPRCVLFTFDDGFREVHDVVAPLLQASGVPAIFFLISSAIDNQDLGSPQKKSLLIRALARGHSAATLNEAGRVLSLRAGSTSADLAASIRATSYRQRHVLDALGPILNCDFQSYLASQRPYVTCQQVETLRRQGFAVGAHSVDHPSYTELSLDEQRAQTRQSMRWLSERFHIRCQSFAFPHRDNGISLDFFRAMAAEGELKLSFGTGGLIPHAWPYNLPRVSTEQTTLTAAEVLAAQFGRYVVRHKVKARWGTSGHGTSWPSFL